MNSQSTRKLRILFVDDELDHVRFHVKALKDDGYEVNPVGSSDAALDLCLRAYTPEPEVGSGQRPFDLVILDMMMPPPKAVQPAQVSAGLATGAFILGAVQKQHKGVPAMIFANLSEQESAESICRVCKTQLPPVPESATHADLLQFLRLHLNVTICEKRRTPPFMLPIRVQEILGKS